MKLSNIASTVIATLALVAGAANAADPAAPVSVNGGTVHFKGELVNAACSVNTDSSEQTVNLGQYRTAKFTKVGDTTSKEGANKRGNSSRLTQSFHFFMFEPI
ncbi:hypothetical protein V6266_02435, partial [Enterobacter asburiae]|uniref:fimbrial protein n=1 Tax=Enterobacter asburiae TaxID=61645 RepID=UPI003B843116